MHKLPLAVKGGLSVGMAFYMSSRLWNDNIYEAELYKVALKYRPFYDKQYQQIKQKEESVANQIEGNPQHKMKLNKL